MAERVKTTAEIRATPDAFKAACARAAVAFGRIAGVISVGFGLKETQGTFGDELAIVVFVSEKKPEQALASAERIPPLFEGYRTDVRAVPRRSPGACDNTSKYSTIQGGIQISNEGERIGNTIFRAFGTLGCIVRRRNHSGRENVYMLSNAHVMYAKGHGPGEAIAHPDPQNGSGLGPIMEGGAYRNVVWPPGTPAPSPLPDPANPDAAINHTNETFVDCAIARLDLDSCCGCTKDSTTFVESIIDLVTVTPPGAGRGDAVHASNRIADVRDVFNDVNFVGEVVTKVGRTTGRTQGRCVSVTVTVHIVDVFDTAVPPAQIFAYNCLEIVPEPLGTLDCKGNAWFAEEGDSGALVVDSQNRAVALLFGVPDPARVPPEPPNASCAAVHIVPVLDHLGICIPCAAGATGHGSSLATDGSGLAPVPLPPAQSTLQAGQIVFTADGGARVQPTAMAPAPMDEAQGRRMHALLEEFRGTRLGEPLSVVIDDVRRELGYLVRNVRPVKVVWGRHQGPAWLAHFLNHIAGHVTAIPQEITGVTRRALLTEMRTVLGVYGSNRLKHALDQHGDAVLSMLTFEGSDSLVDVVEWIRKREHAKDLEHAEDRARDESPAAEEVS
ncbi:MAG TPA: hypothetical protein VI485_29820 [Vicinamibacterales bacterium]|nr:hypothetical protein [Vicinamibacterales bacterium]